MTFTRSALRRASGGLVAALALALAAPLVQSGAAQADTAPVPPVTVPTVSADVLPTAQLNGVAWAQTVVGNRVFVTGSFTTARPAGAAAGTGETPRSNLLAYDIRTGALDTAIAPALNAQGLAIVGSADGTRVFVGGDFTTVNGVTHNRIVALDATTGAVISSFTASFSGTVSALAVSGNTLYVGGGFTTSSGQPRTRLAAVNATTGALLPWAPTADRGVLALTAPAGTGVVVAGGHFSTLNGGTALGMGALDATTGASLPWAVGSIAYDYGSDAAIYSLTSDGDTVYGTGYNFLIHPSDTTTGGNLENTFAAKAVGGDLVWIAGCRGDTYSAAVLNGVVYNVGHAHNCSPIGGNPETNPRSYQHALAYQQAPAADGRLNIGGDFTGRPAPELLHWYPDLVEGSYTKQYQAAWSVSGNGTYVVLGGEFPTVNGIAQQGLVRFAVRSAAPNKEGPQDYVDLKPTVTAIAPGVVRASWVASSDRDNRRLTYEVLRGATAGSSTVLTTRTQDSAWFDRPPMAFTDRTATPGSSQTYRVRVTDALGNTLTTGGSTVTVPSGTAAASPYADAVTSDSPSNYWRLGEAGGVKAYDWASGNDVAVASDTQRGTPGALTGDTDAASTFSGAATVPGTSATPINGPQTFSVEAWFKTTSTKGGKIVGFGNSNTADSSNYDRHLYLTNTGKLVFGVYNNAVSTLTTPASYNDGAWHQVVGTLGGGTMTLYVDGAKIDSRADVPFAQSYSGYWRIGGDNLNGWPNGPSSSKLAGSIDEVAVYPSVLAADRVATHWGVGTAANKPPTASFTSAPTNLQVAFDASASADSDGTVASYAWDFGDGSTGTGKTVTHTYASASTYQVKLTVTDDKGATGTVTKPVTVNAGAAALASDAFSRTVTGGWGSADTGGAWTTSGATSNFAVAGGVGTMKMPTAGYGPSAMLNSVSSSATDVTVTMSSDKAATGNGIYISVIGRHTAGGDYRGKARVQANGTVAVSVSSVVGGTETLLGGKEVVVSGLTYSVGTKLRMRLQVQGTTTTTVRVKVWDASSAEPTAWLISQTDSTGALQGAGSVGLMTYLSGSATNAPVTVSFDDLSVQPL